MREMRKNAKNSPYNSRTTTLDSSGQAEANDFVVLEQAIQGCEAHIDLTDTVVVLCSEGGVGAL